MISLIFYGLGLVLLIRASLCSSPSFCRKNVDHTSRNAERATSISWRMHGFGRWFNSTLC